VIRKGSDAYFIYLSNKTSETCLRFEAFLYGFKVVGMVCGKVFLWREQLVEVQDVRDGLRLFLNGLRTDYRSTVRR
jgi:hypothetical protein